MEKTQELFSYPIVVIESLWPKIPEEAPKLVGEKYLDQPDADKAVNAYLYSETQNAFSGYFKIIPLNVKSITVNAGKDGHSFNVSFDPSYVYVQFDPRYVSRNVYNYIVQNSFEFTRTENVEDKTLQNLNYLSGILEGFSKAEMESSQFSEIEFEHYFVPGNVISKFINEMDTVTIFLIQDLSIFDQDELIKLAGGGFSRRREVEALPGTKKLADLGIVKPADSDNLESVSISEKLQSLRSLLFNNSLGKYSYSYNEFPSPQSVKLNFSTLNPTPYRPETSEIVFSTRGVGNNSLLSTQIQEISNIQNAINILVYNTNKNISKELDAFGTIVSGYLTDQLLLKTTTSEKIDILQSIQANIYNYYSGGQSSLYSKMYHTLSWTLFESIRILFNKYVNTSVAGRDLIILRIIQTVAIDLYFQDNYPELYVNLLQLLSETNTNNYTVPFNLVNDTMALLIKRFAAAPQHQSTKNIKDIDDNLIQKQSVFYGFTAYDYFTGLEFFFTYVIKPFILEDEKEKTKSGKTNAPTLVDPNGINLLKNLNLEDNLKILDDLTNLAYPLSCETPYFVLNGHISQITDSSSVSTSNYTRSITISGTGFELPMKSHQIYIDVSNGYAEIYKNLAQMMISNATPIAAALSIMAMHLPDYAQFFEKFSTKAKDLKIADQRNFALYSSAVGLFVEKGTALFKRPADSSEFFILAPIHYIDKSYLKIIKSTFDSTLIATSQILTEQRTINSGSVYDNLKAFLSNSSMYSFFVDEFGTLKLRFEPSAVTQTNSTILSPYVTDKNLISLSITSDQSQIQTLVEILPKPLSGITGQSQSFLYSRATPPDIVDAYGLYKPLDLAKLIDDQPEEFYNFMYLLSETFKDALETIVDHYNKTYKPKTNITYTKPVVYEELLSYETKKESLRNLLVESYKTEEEKAEDEEKRRQKEEEEKAAEEEAKGAGAANGTQQAPTPANSGASTVVTADDSPLDHCIDDEKPATAATATSAATTQQKATEKTEQELKSTEPATRESYTIFYTRASKRNENTPDYVNILYDRNQNFSTYIPRGIAIRPFTMNGTFFNSFSVNVGNSQYLVDYEIVKNDIGVEFTYYDYLRYRIYAKLTKTYESNFSSGGIFYLGKLSFESIDILLEVLASLARLGVLGGKAPLNRIKNNINAKITDEKTVKNYVSWMIRYTKLFYVPQKLSDLDEQSVLTNKNFIVEEKQSRRIPVNNFTIQDLNPRSISSDLFRYGLRRSQYDDFYAQTSQLTDFRAETLRKLYEYPMKTASMSILLNSMYKVGNTLLVVSENMPNNKNTYINLGVKRMLETTNVKDVVGGADTEAYNLYLRVDDIVKKDGLTLAENKLYAKLTGISGEIKESTVINHFKEAAEFLTGETNNPKGFPVPSDAYIPLLGIYSNKNREKTNKVSEAVVKYLRAVLNFYITTVDPKTKKNYLQKFDSKKGYPAIYSDVEDAIIEVYKAVFGGDETSYSIDNFNLLSRLLSPQNYHVYQYHINNVTHNWSFGKNSTTNLSGTFGTPAIMAYVPTDKSYEFEKHIVGHMTTTGPNHFFNDYGSPNVKLTQNNLPESVLKQNKGSFSNTNVAYKFSIEQLIQEEKYYKSKYRYKLEYILEKIRRKYTMPELYGDIIFRQDKNAKTQIIKPEPLKPIFPDDAKLPTVPIVSGTGSNVPDQNKPAPSTSSSGSTPPPPPPPNSGSAAATGTATPTPTIAKTFSAAIKAASSAKPGDLVAVFPIGNKSGSLTQRVSYYSLSPDETDKDNLVGACNCNVFNSTVSSKQKIALSRDLLGDPGKYPFCRYNAKLKLLIDENGRTLKNPIELDVIIWDTMNKRYTKSVDILVFSGKTDALSLKNDKNNAVGIYRYAELSLYKPTSKAFGLCTDPTPFAQ